MELWKSLSFMGYPNYEMSNYGHCLGPMGIVRGHIHHRRHCTVICNDEGRHTYSTRLLVAKCFLPNPDNLLYVRCYSADPTNNTVANLYWSKVASAPAAKLTKDQIEYIRSVYIKGDHKYGQTALAAQFKVANSTIQHILFGKTWKD